MIVCCCCEAVSALWRWRRAGGCSCCCGKAADGRGTGRASGCRNPKVAVGLRVCAEAVCTA
eukprot:3278803-Prymnesium_polylepis.1